MVDYEKMMYIEQQKNMSLMNSKTKSEVGQYINKAIELYEQANSRLYKNNDNVRVDNVRKLLKNNIQKLKEVKTLLDRI